MFSKSKNATYEKVHTSLINTAKEISNPEQKKKT